VRNARQWLRDHKRCDLAFRAAVEERRWTLIQFARHFGLDLLGAAMDLHQQMLMDLNTTDANRIKLMEMLYKLNNQRWAGAGTCSVLVIALQDHSPANQWPIWTP
jgi:hypothetical protein